MNDNHSREAEKGRRSLLITAALAILISLILIVGIIWKHEVGLRQEEKSRKDKVAKGPRINVVKAKKGPRRDPSC